MYTYNAIIIAVSYYSTNGTIHNVSYIFAQYKIEIRKTEIN